MGHAPFPLLLILLFISLPSFLKVSSLTSVPREEFTLSPEKTPSYASPAIMRKLLSDDREARASSTATSTTAVSSSKNNFKKSQDFYGADAHEVPSGPNPESN